MRSTRWFILMMAAALALSACAPAATLAAPSATPAPAPTATEAAPAEDTGDSAAPVADCTVVSSIPTPDPTEIAMTSRFPEVTDADWTEGADNATVTFLEYSDLQCPYCAQLSPVLSQLVEKFPDDVRVVFRHFPLPSHTHSLLGAQAAEAAGQQGKFFEMLNTIFAAQATWIEYDDAEFESWLVEQATALELDVDQFKTDMKAKAIVEKVAQAQQDGIDLGIPGTPFILINSRIYQGPSDLANLAAIVELFKLEAKQYTACPPQVIDPAKEYIATIKTEKGDITLQLLPDKAPIAVNSFVFLAREGWFNNATFHRVLPGFVAQGGDPTGTGFGGPGYAFKNEISDVKFDKEGLLAMANAGPDSNGSQFFITLDAASNLDGDYTIFGEVIKGMDVVKELTPRDPSTEADLPPGDKILSVTIEEK